MNFNNPTPKKAKKKPEVFYTSKDLLNYENKSVFRAFGKMVASTKISNPLWSFGKGSKKKFKNCNFPKKPKKNFDKNQVKIPIDKRKKDINAPEWSFGGGRNRSDLITKHPYDYYKLKDLYSDPGQADLYRKQKRMGIKFPRNKRVG